MKKLIFLGATVFCCPVYAENATKGAITEALFIIQNKQVEVQEYIQELKKELTQCSLAASEKGAVSLKHITAH